MIQNLNEELFSFIKKSPTGFHAVHELANYLTEAGFECLAEGNIEYFKTKKHSPIPGECLIKISLFCCL